ncbi:hypothetical protein H4582DRAFT_948919, partial [Lactarius indigo]
QERAQVQVITRSEGRKLIYRADRCPYQKFQGAGITPRLAPRRLTRGIGIASCLPNDILQTSCHRLFCSTIPGRSSWAFSLSSGKGEASCVATHGRVTCTPAWRVILFQNQKLESLQDVLLDVTLSIGGGDACIGNGAFKLHGPPSNGVRTALIALKISGAPESRIPFSDACDLVMARLKDKGCVKAFFFVEEKTRFYATWREWWLYEFVGVCNGTQTRTGYDL